MECTKASGKRDRGLSSQSPPAAPRSPGRARRDAVQQVRKRRVVANDSSKFHTVALKSDTRTCRREPRTAGSGPGQVNLVEGSLAIPGRGERAQGEERRDKAAAAICIEGAASSLAVVVDWCISSSEK